MVSVRSIRAPPSRNAVWQVWRIILPRQALILELQQHGVLARPAGVDRISPVAYGTGEQLHGGRYREYDDC